MNSIELIKRLQIELRRSLIVCASSRAEACQAPRAVPAHASVNGQFYSLLLTGRSGFSSTPRHLAMHHVAVVSIRWQPRSTASGKQCWCNPGPRECAFYSQADSHDDDFLWCHTICSEASKILGFAAPSCRTQAEKTTAFNSQGVKYCHWACLRERRRKKQPLCDNSGLCVIPESPTTAEALWKCDESTLKEMIALVFWLNLTSKRSQRDSQWSSYK